MSWIQLIIVPILFFLGVIGFLKFLFDKYLSSALKRLQELHNRNLEKEVALNKELERAIQHRQSEIAKGKEEADKLKAQAKEEALKFKEQLTLQAKQEAEIVLKEAKQECERLKREVFLQAGEKAENLATETIRGIFNEKAKQTFGRDLIDELIENLYKIDKNKFKLEVKKAEVISAYPLIESQKNILKERLRDITGQEIQLEEKIDASVISGLIINLGGVVIDGSLSNKMRQIIAYLRQEERK